MPRGYIKLLIFILIAGVVGWIWAWGHRNLADIQRDRHGIRPLLPVNSVMLVTQGKRNEYQQLAPGDGVTVELQGPGRLDVLTRGHFDPAKNTIRGRYTLRMRVNSQKSVQFTKSASRSFMTRYESDPRFGVGEIRSYRVDVPDGLHRIRVALPKKQKERVNVRFLYHAFEKREYQWSRIHPTDSKEKPLIQVAGKLRRYDTLGWKKSVTYALEGPTQLKLLTRWTGVGDPTSGKGGYSVLIRQDSGIKMKRSFLVPSDEGALIPKAEAGMVVGRPVLMYTYVPSGKHAYSIYAKSRKGINKILVRAFEARSVKPPQAPSTGADPMESPQSHGKGLKK